MGKQKSMSKQSHRRMSHGAKNNQESQGRGIRFETDAYAQPEFGNGINWI